MKGLLVLSITLAVMLGTLAHRAEADAGVAGIGRVLFQYGE